MEELSQIINLSCDGMGRVGHFFLILPEKDGRADPASHQLQQSGEWSTPGQHSRAAPEGAGVGDATLP